MNIKRFILQKNWFYSNWNAKNFLLWIINENLLGIQLPSICVWRKENSIEIQKTFLNFPWDSEYETRNLIFMYAIDKGPSFP